jgi:hypothetical protein
MFSCLRNYISFRMAVGSFADHCTSKAKTVQNKREFCHSMAWTFRCDMGRRHAFQYDVAHLSSGTTSGSEATYIMHCDVLRSHVVWRSLLSSQDHHSCPRKEGGISTQVLSLNWTYGTSELFFSDVLSNEVTLVVIIEAVGLGSSGSTIVQCLVFGRWNFQTIG